jgi:hypothetical protein
MSYTWYQKRVREVFYFTSEMPHPLRNRSMGVYCGQDAGGQMNPLHKGGTNA